MNAIQIIQSYHESTKHLPSRYARSLGYMDWDTQPDPFRRFRESPCTQLLLPEMSVTPTYDDLYKLGSIAIQPINLNTISELFQYSLALTAWKEYQGSRWALRVNPSSGNLHPTEGYLVINAVNGLTKTPGVFHYAPKEHMMERRCEMPTEVWDRLVHEFPLGTFFVGLSSIHWREAWKYGERAYRYCQHDIGHALAAISLSASLQGWQTKSYGSLCDEELSILLGLNRKADFENAEQEHPCVLIAVIPSIISIDYDHANCLPSEVLQLIQSAVWHGTANQLSTDHVEWELIETVATACVKLSTPEIEISTQAIESFDKLDTLRPAIPARAIIYQRRSAVAMDGHTSINASQLYLMMDRVLPRFDHPLWDTLGPPALVHLGLFVHLVEGLSPGLYFLVREPNQLTLLQESMKSEFKWLKPTECPRSLPFYQLTTGDVRALAGQVSCGQEIAAKSAFSLSMIANFDESLQSYSPWIYRRLFWETGMIGQVLYLEAEAAGIRSTGIGCFFDDLVHKVFGFKNNNYQSLYHFTIGGPIEDTRLTTQPPYAEKLSG